MSRSISVVRAAIVGVAVCSCSGGPASSLAKPPEYQPGKGQGKCSVKGGQEKPLIVEWPSSARGDLELRAKRGIVAVRYVGCEMEILPRCIAPGAYKYGAFTAKDDTVVIRNEDELFASIPVGAARLEAKLQTAGQLTVAMKLVGKYESDRDQLRRDELKGPCEGATHFIAGLTVGSFDFFAGAESEVSGGANVVLAGAGAKTASKRETLTRDGSAEACAKATQNDTAPPDQCGAVLRLEVIPLGEAKVAEASCPAGSSWDGRKCAAQVDTSCGGGMHFEAGRGCVANVVAASAPSGGMARIPAGTFMMGSNDGDADEKPVHQVSVRAFEMDLTEVTVAAYQACVSSGRCTQPGTGDYCNWGQSAKDNHPINCVNWGQATAYCVSEGKRLPTEEEWEHAARGSQGRQYPWGDEAPGGQLCWKRWDSKLGTCAVGSYPSGDSPFGLHDMAGNVWEWTSSGYSEDYGKNRASDKRAIRGGSWNHDNPRRLRGAHRNGADPSDRTYALGFRCAR